MIKAIIFDMDGVISDTQNIQSKVDSDILNEFGIVMSVEEISKKYAGMRTDFIYKEIFSQYNVYHDVTEILNEKNSRLSQLSNEIKSIPGAIELIAETSNANFKIAVASSSDKRYIFTVLEKLNITDKFDVIVSAFDVNLGKPAPDIFLLAAKKLNVAPSSCLVIEDGIHGMTAAKAAGMKCIGLTNNRQAPADLIINSFSEIDIETIKNL